MDDVTWGALTLTLTIIGSVWTWLSFRRRGVASGLRAAAFTLLPVAAYLTRTLRMFSRILEAVADWATGLVFSPQVWLGVVVAGVSVLLFVVSGVLRARSGPAAPAEPAREVGGREARKTRGAVGPGKGRGGAGDVGDLDDLDDIEAILRRRGIT